MSIKIPITGRLGKLANTISEKTSKKNIQEVFNDYKTSMKGKELGEWILLMIKSLENKLGKKKANKIMEKEGRKSCILGFKNTVKKIKVKSDNIQMLIKDLQEHYKRSSFFEYINKNTIISGHYGCYLMIKSATKPISSKTFCYFCLGHGKEFFEIALNVPLVGTIIETVMKGGNNCKFRF